MVFHWSLSDNKSPQVSKTLLSILAYLNNAIVWIVSARPVISTASSTSIHLFFTFFQFYFVVSLDSKVHNSASSFFLYYHKVRSFGRDQVIRFYVKFPLEFVCVIL